jgi:hypothetical protein
MNSKKLIITIIISIIIAIIIILFGYLIKKQMMTNTEIKYTYNTKSVFAKDGNSYKVHNFADADKAADSLAEINSHIVKLISHLKYKYIGGGYQNNKNNQNIQNNDNIQIVDSVNKILNRYNPDNLVENSPKDKQDTSYTLNKGSTIAFCLREKKDSSLHDINTLLFVGIHELAHIGIDDNEHPPKFWKMFKFLLQEAEEAGIYKSQNYNQLPVHYCGMDINYNPIYDNTI